MRAALCCATLALASAARASDPAALFPVVQGGKWGYVDATGRLVVPPRFDRAGRFSEGLAPVQLGGTHGYADRTGEIVLVPEHAPAGTLHAAFSSGLAPVRVGTRFGYVDRSGKLALPAGYLGAEEFSDGYAMACVAAGCGYIDPRGRYVIPPEFMASRPVKGGIACANTAMAMGRERVVLFEVAGRRRLPGEYGGCGAASGGLLAVKLAGRWGYVDASGAPTIAPRFTSAGEFVDGLAPARDGELCGYIDRSGEFAVAPAFRECAPFSGGLARVDLARRRDEAERIAFVDRTGKPVIVGAELRPPFDSAEDFRDGLAAVGAGGPPHLAGAGGPMLGYVDAAGRWIWKPTR